MLSQSKKLLEANREAGTAFFLGLSEGAWPQQHLHVRILTSTTMNSASFCRLSHLFAVLYYNNPTKHLQYSVKIKPNIIKWGRHINIWNVGIPFLLKHPFMLKNERRGHSLKNYVLCWEHDILATQKPMCFLTSSDHTKSLRSSLTLYDAVNCSSPGSSVHGSLQAGILEWVATSFSRESSWPRDRTRISYVSCIGGRFFTTSTTLPWKPALTGKIQFLSFFKWIPLMD